MIAVIRAGGKQYRAEEGAILEIELPKKGLSAGERLTSEEILLLEDNGKTVVGTPRVAGAKAVLEVLEEIRAPKVVAFRYRRRKGYHRTVGHRQRLARVRVVEFAIEKKDQ
ncbi:50S ribosomal protein L21 [Methylacidimicrobium cyclopophantes]|uniref:Large ribosomal subunit protein bL21 n=1 Tax=Methylacidimicrobium cyclopophantes TaxID=1041766 RepID=A0A5E6MHD0_9BACT|nr:50S ribosomal protein L21 [Methylacidimicrobium cyclopophantes]VVM07637.1 50S ribosomal protein L21 [Methylacidimicrobium cyclopophantes]